LGVTILSKDENQGKVQSPEIPKYKSATEITRPKINSIPIEDTEGTRDCDKINDNQLPVQNQNKEFMHRADAMYHCKVVRCTFDGANASDLKEHVINEHSILPTEYIRKYKTFVSNFVFEG
jgi:hypothetical protein